MANYLTRDEILEIPEIDMPLVVLSDDLWSWVARKIRAHTMGNYNHAMVLYRPGICASQGLFYKDVLIEKYLRHHRVKFWHNPNWTLADRAEILSALDERLSAPWYRRLYDFRGILGQFVGQPRWMRWARAVLQSPFRYYCSEDVARVLKHVDGTWPLRWPSPADLNREFKKNPKYVEYGRFDPDE